MPHTPSEQAWLKQLPSPWVASASWGVQPGTQLMMPSCQAAGSERQAGM
jgi:hypothetical protein